LTGTAQNASIVAGARADLNLVERQLRARPASLELALELHTHPTFTFNQRNVAGGGTESAPWRSALVIEFQGCIGQSATSW